MTTKALLYYTCLTHPFDIELACRARIAALRGDMELVTVSLNQEILLGDVRIMLKGKRSPEMMHHQILTGLEHVNSDIVFMIESDVLYHPSHFEFIPPRDDTFYYNENTYKVDSQTGQAVFYYTKQLSGLCAYRDLLLEHYRKRAERIEQVGRYERGMGYEPGCHVYPKGVDYNTAERWMSAWPNVDIRHPKTQTKTRWSTEEFRNKNTCLGWELVDAIPGGWGRTKGRFAEFLSEVNHGLPDRG